MRDCLGRFASGVTIVTARTDRGFVGMTANSFTSVSLSPPLVLWCPAKSASRYSAFADASHFAIHVLRTDQEAVARAFARSGDAFDGLQVSANAEGVPVFDACLARFECETFALHDAGDHAILVGRVRRAALAEGTPLVFSQGAFITFDKEA
ncbi:MAG: flavin reductase family protein [Roseobacter sp.]|nr:flavin reductase family protein [Roseobacter sp.]